MLLLLYFPTNFSMGWISHTDYVFGHGPQPVPGIPKYFSIAVHHVGGNFGSLGRRRPESQRSNPPMQQSFVNLGLMLH